MTREGFLRIMNSGTIENCNEYKAAKEDYHDHPGKYHSSYLGNMRKVLSKEYSFFRRSTKGTLSHKVHIRLKDNPTADINAWCSVQTARSYLEGKGSEYKSWIYLSKEDIDFLRSRGARLQYGE